MCKKELELWLFKAENIGTMACLNHIEELLENAPDRNHEMYHYLEGFVHGRAMHERFRCDLNDISSIKNLYPECR